MLKKNGLPCFSAYILWTFGDIKDFLKYMAVLANLAYHMAYPAFSGTCHGNSMVELEFGQEKCNLEIDEAGSRGTNAWKPTRNGA